MNSATNERYKRKSEFFFVDSLQRARLSLIQYRQTKLSTVHCVSQRSTFVLELAKVVRRYKNPTYPYTRRILAGILLGACYHVLNNFPPTLKKETKDNPIQYTHYCDCFYLGTESFGYKIHPSPSQRCKPTTIRPLKESCRVSFRFALLLLSLVLVLPIILMLLLVLSFSV